MKQKIKTCNCGRNPVESFCWLGCKLKVCEHCIHREIYNLNDIEKFWCSKHNIVTNCNNHCKYYNKDIKVINGDRL